MNVPATASALALISYLILTVVVYRQRVNTRVQRLFLIYLIVMMIWQAVAILVSITVQPDIATTAYKMMTALGGVHFIIYYLFVREFLHINAHQRLVTFAFLGLIIIPLVTMLSGTLIIASVYADEVTGLLVPNFGALVIPLGIYSYGYLGLGTHYLYRAVRSARTDVERNRMQYMYVGGMLVMLGTVANFFPNLKAYPIDVVANIINALLIAYAILRYQLLDINIVVRRGVLYSFPTAVISAGYMLAVFLVVNLFSTLTSSQITLVYVSVAIIVAIAFHPLYTRLQDWVDRLFFREKYDANLMIRRLSRSVSTVLDIEQLADMILDEIVQTMHVTRAALLLQDAEGDGYTPLTARGFEPMTRLRLRYDNPIVRTLLDHKEILSRYDLEVMPQFKALLVREREDLRETDAELFVPLMTRDDLIGILVLAAKRSGASFATDEQLTLLTLANQTAVAVQNAHLYQTALDEKERAEVILEHAFAGIVLVDADRQIVKVNPGAESLTGFSAAALEGTHLGEILDIDLLAVNELKNAGTGQPDVQVTTLTTASGARRDILLGTTPIAEGFLLNFADITHLREVDRLKSNIVASVSHELRTPLASIMGYSELLLDGYADDDEQLTHQFLTIINDEAGRLSKLITDLLDLSRLESGRIEPQMALTSIDDIIQRSLRTLNVQAREAGVDVTVDVPEDLPLFVVDVSMMTIIIKNLLDNSIKFSPDGGSVGVSVRQVGDDLVMEFTDQGTGIPQEEWPYLFTKFYRSPAVQRAGIKGTGLGLALAKEAVEMHGGLITMESEVGAGSKFIVTLPLAVHQPEPDAEFALA